MAVIDKIRMAARRADCIVGVFPDDGGRIYSPLTESYRLPDPAYAGARDADDGLLSLYHAKAEGGGFVPISGGTGDTSFCVRTGYSLSGEEAHHTMLVKVFIPSANFSMAEARHTVRLFWQGSTNSNCTWGIGLSYSPTSDTATLQNAVFLQSPREYSKAGSGSTSCSSTLSIPAGDLTDRWIVLASTVIGAESRARYFLDGQFVKENAFGSRAYDTTSPKQRRTIFRNDTAVNDSAKRLKMGAEDSESTIGYTGIRFGWGLVFNSILSDEEIRNLSE